MYTEFWRKASGFRFSAVGIAAVLVVIAFNSKPAAAQATTPYLAPPIVFEGGPNASGLAAGDLNLDGFADIVVVGGTCVLEQENPLAIFFNTGEWNPATGGFKDGYATLLPDCYHAQEVIVANLNDDTLPDIAFSGAGLGAFGQIVIMYNDPVDPNDPNDLGKTYDVVATTFQDVLDVHGLIADDFDDDGDIDLAVAGRYDPNDILEPPAAGVIVFLENVANESFSRRDLELVDFSTTAWDLTSAKFDVVGDVVDLATCNLNDNSICQITDGASWSANVTTVVGPQTGTPFEYTSVAAGRLDTDGVHEIACPYVEYGNADVFRHDPNTYLFIHERPNGEDSGDQYQFSDEARLESGAIGRVNAGGQRDLVMTVAGSAELAIFLGNGNGTLIRPPLSWSTEPPGGSADEAGPARDVILVDVNDDGLLDIVVANGYPQQNISVLLNSYTPVEE